MAQIDEMNNRKELIFAKETGMQLASRKRRPSLLERGDEEQAVCLGLMPKWFPTIGKGAQLAKTGCLGGTKRGPEWKSLAADHFRPLHCLIVLPLLCIFLLPTLKLEAGMQLQPNRLGDQVDIRRGEEVATTSRIAHFVAALLRLPIERIRLQAGLPLAAAALAPPKRDLQEEEQTHVMLLAPADQRASYAAPTQAGHQHAAYLEAHPPGEPAHLAAPGDPYATSGATGHPQQADEQSSAAGQVAEAQPMGALVGSEGSSSTSGSLQVRSDLPAVRALNVKCEKNHMTVS